MPCSNASNLFASLQYGKLATSHTCKRTSKRGTLRPMPVIAIAGQKGGAGKSTLAIHLAAEWHARGKRVVLVDADPQGTATTWADVATEGGHSAPVVVAMGDSLRRDVPKLAESADVVVLDLPGRAVGSRAVGGLIAADVAVLPCGPSPADLWALAGSIDVVREVLALRPELVAVVVLNRADRSGLTKGTHDALADVGLPVLEQVIGARVAFAEAMAAGQGVTVYASGSVAANEIRRLADELELLAGIDRPKTKGKR